MEESFLEKFHATLPRIDGGTPIVDLRVLQNYADDVLSSNQNALVLRLIEASSE